MSHDNQMTAPAPTPQEQVRLDALYRVTAEDIAGLVTVSEVSETGEI